MSGGVPRIEIWRMTKDQFLYYLSDPEYLRTLRRIAESKRIKLHVRVPAGREGAM